MTLAVAAKLTACNVKRWLRARQRGALRTKIVAQAPGRGPSDERAPRRLSRSSNPAAPRRRLTWSFGP